MLNLAKDQFTLLVLVPLKHCFDWLRLFMRWSEPMFSFSVSVFETQQLDRQLEVCKEQFSQFCKNLKIIAGNSSLKEYNSRFAEQTFKTEINGHVYVCFPSGRWSESEKSGAI